MTRETLRVRSTRGVTGLRPVTQARTGTGPPKSRSAPAQDAVVLPERSVYAALYGPPRAGVTSAATVLAGASHASVIVVHSLSHALQADPLGGHVVLLEPYPTSVAEALLLPKLGHRIALAIRIEADDSALASRGVSRERLAAWRFQAEEIESHLTRLGVARHTILNVDLATTVAELARRLSLSD